MSKVLSWLRAEPAAAYVTAASVIVALIVAFAHLDSAQAGYLSAIVTGLGTIVTALMARPVSVAVISGAAATVLQALVVFGLHMSSPEIAAVVAAVNLVLGFVAMRPQLTPLVHMAAKKTEEAAA